MHVCVYVCCQFLADYPLEGRKRIDWEVKTVHAGLRA